VCVDGSWYGANARKGSNYGGGLCISANNILVENSAYVYLTLATGGPQYYICQGGTWYSSDPNRKAIGVMPSPPQITGVVQAGGGDVGGDGGSSGYRQGGYFDLGSP
jgi:hypothetical protein